MASYRIGAKLKQQRLALGVTINDVSRETRIASRFLEAIEADDFENLPGLVFTRNFVRQFALSLKMEPAPLLAELPALDESTIRLPDPPSRPRSPNRVNVRLRSALSSAMWLLAAGATLAAWFHFNHPARVRARGSLTRSEGNTTPRAGTAHTAPPPATAVAVLNPPVRAESPVQVVITAHQPAWLQVSVDGKTAFTGTLQPDESKELGAEGQVKIVAGNAGALTISLNGKTLEPLGPVGQVRVVRLTAEGPELLTKDPPSAPDPL